MFTKKEVKYINETMLDKVIAVESIINNKEYFDEETKEFYVKRKGILTSILEKVNCDNNE